MKTLLTIFTLVFTLMFSPTSFAEHDFTYKNVFACGPEVLDIIPPRLKSKYYVIHDNEEGNKFSIYWGDQEYASFKEIHNSELYVRIGGESWLTFQKIGDSIIRFELHYFHKERGKSLSVLTFDAVGMSAVVKQSWREEADLLVCWKYN